MRKVGIWWWGGHGGRGVGGGGRLMGWSGVYRRRLCFSTSQNSESERVVAIQADVASHSDAFLSIFAQFGKLAIATQRSRRVHSEAREPDRLFSIAWSPLFPLFFPLTRLNFSRTAAAREGGQTSPTALHIGLSASLGEKSYSTTTTSSSSSSSSFSPVPAKPQSAPP